MDLELVGKRAIVTGGSRGIGLAVAEQLAAEGCDVALVARTPDALTAAAAAVAAASGRRVVPVVADTSDTASVRSMVDVAVATLGGVDILVNSAALSSGNSRAGTVSPEALGADLDVKALGYLRCAQAVAPHLVARGWGRIVNVAGLAARQSGAVAAAMRNAAVVALTKNLADEMGPAGVNVTAVHPGTTRTGRIERVIAGRAAERGVDPEVVAREMGAAYATGRLARPHEVAWVVAFLASPRSVTVNGDVVACGGGRIGAVYG